MTRVRVVQRVWAIGKPPDDVPCFFRNLRNVVVMPSVGELSVSLSHDLDEILTKRPRQTFSCINAGWRRRRWVRISRFVLGLWMLTLLSSDEFLIIKEPTLLPTEFYEPANYEGVKAVELDRDSNIDDICDFFVEYMQSDVMVRRVSCQSLG